MRPIDVLAIGLAVLATSFGLFAVGRLRRARDRIEAGAQAEARYRNLVERVPAVTYLWDAARPAGSAPAPYISPQIESMLGFTAEEWQADPRLWHEQAHPDDVDRVLADWDRASAAGEPFAAEYRLFARDGRTVWVRDEASTVARDETGRPIYQGIMLDVTERKLAEESLRRREAILESLGFAAERFLSSDSWEAGMDEVLERLGGAAYASRCYVFENRVDEDGETRQTMTHEWAAPGVLPVSGSEANHDCSYRASGLERWEQLMGAGVPVYGNVAVFPEPEREWLAAQGVVSIVMVPLVVGSEWWGYIGFDECTTERDWAPAEIEALKAAADTLGAAIGRARSETRLYKAEVKYRTLVEQVPAIVYIVAGDDINTAVYMSPYYERMLGYTPEERLADPDLWVRLLHPGDRDRVLAASRRSRSTGEPFAEEYRLFAKDGRVVWVRDEAVLVSDDAGRPMFQQGIMVDITERKCAQEELEETLGRLRKTDQERQRLLSALVRAQEEERRRIASDIHDDSIQKMVAAAMRIDMWRIAHPEVVEEEGISKLAESVRLAINSLRHLMFELRPDAIDRDGLVSVLTLYLEEQGKMEGAPEFSLESRLWAEPSGEVRIQLYRIAQEAVTNTRKHAGASRVDVLLAEQDGGVLLRVTDDGVGFDIDASPESPVGHLGLTSMRERAEMAGGRVTVQSRLGHGTSIEAWVSTDQAAGAQEPGAPSCLAS